MDKKQLTETSLPMKAPSSGSCPFCSLPDVRVVHENGFAVVIRDAFPVTAGHTLVLPRRHLGSFFELDRHERDAMFDLLAVARDALDREFKPAGYNIGINDGQAAGQTIAHLHVHLIPRSIGDRADPRGGVRWIFPERADYWSTRDCEPN